jgi:hypothetical protein
MYPADNQEQLISNDRFSANGHVYDTTAPATSDYWCPGDLQTSPLVATNTLFLTAGTLFRYESSIPVYHCPGDKTTVTVAGQQQLRARSYSMSVFMHGNDSEVASLAPGYFNNHKPVDIRTPGPSDAIVFCEEGNSMDDGQFGFNPALQGDPAFQGWNWLNSPAFYHPSATAFSFADGHGEIHHWSAGALQVMATVPYSGIINYPDPSSDHKDISWVKMHMAAH